MNRSALVPLLMGSLYLGLAVAIGAFGAHGLKDVLVDKYLSTFQTGVEYQYYHGFALMILGLIKFNFKEINLKISFYAFTIGILLFSFNCYFYAITKMKSFAMIVPFGGVLFLLGWFVLVIKLYKGLKESE